MVGDGSIPFKTLLHWQLELPGVWFGQEGQIARSYDENALTAFNAWQVDEWVTIIEVEGGVAQALPCPDKSKNGWQSITNSKLPEIKASGGFSATGFLIPALLFRAGKVPKF